MTTLAHPSWCALDRCDAVVGDEPPDYSGAHRSVLCKAALGLLQFELAQAVEPRATKVFLAFSVPGQRWAYPLDEVAPSLLALLASAGYVTSTEDGR